MSEVASVKAERTASEGRRSWIVAGVGATLFTVALFVLQRELAALHYHELTSALFAMPAGRLALALLLTVANYLVLAGYDLAAFNWIGVSLDRRRVAAVSMLSYAIANSVGFGMLSGASVRYRFYTRWGVGAADLSRVVLFYTTTFLLGFLTLGGLSLALAPLPAFAGHEHARAAGIALLLVAAAYAALACTRREPLRLFGLEVPMPGPRATAAQFLLSTIDWLLAAGVLWALLPGGRMGFLSFSGAFLAAHLAGVISHVPGGIGVFETALVILCKPALSAGDLLPALVAYRVVYYLIPFVLALAGLAADELWQRRHAAARVGSLFGAAARAITPRLLAVLVFLAGALLLFSGATPAAHGRLGWLDRFLPLAVLELSHFAGSVAGVALLLLSQGISRRLDVSYYLTVAVVGVGLAASLLKGGDYEEAALLGMLLLLALWPARVEFDRRAAFFATRFSPGWVAAVVSVVSASVVLGFFAFKHVEYTPELWWQFAAGAEASRFLRASVGSGVLVLAFGISRLLRPAPHEVGPPGEEDLADAERVIASQGRTLPFLAFLRDKALLFDEERAGFVMYAVQGRTWVALGDPVGPPARAGGLVRAFLERADDFEGTPVFYQATPERLHLYADFGLAFVKLGEEARVGLEGFGLEGRENKGFRNTLSRLERSGARFRLLPREEVPPLLPELRRVSDEWLLGHRAGEKGFSLGFFDERYLTRFPAAVLEREGRVEAFANVWPGPDRGELSSDLMRHRPDAPNGAMEALFLHLMLWGKEKGYGSFNLGMAPLSGLESSAVAPLWNRLATFVYERGESLYNFQGLRAFKEKFHPVWEPRYLAWPGGLALPRVLADISALIAGGYGRMFRK